MKKYLPISLAVLVIVLGILTLLKIQSRRARIISDEQALAIHRNIKGKLGLTKKERELFTGEDRDGIFGHVIMVGDGTFNTRIDALTGKVALFHNHQLAENLYKERKKLPKTVQATRTEKEILELANQYIQVITGAPAPQDYCLKRLEYDNKGEWAVIYKRISSGYEYLTNTDAIGVYIADVSGELISFMRWPESKHCPTEAKISEEKAKKVASKVALQFIEDMARIEGEKISIKDFNISVLSSELKIVNPNYLFSEVRKKWRRAQVVQTLKTRLAYVVSVKITEAGKSSSCKMTVFVDAATGKALGGDPGVWR